jgi:glycosyltransferase involved in cell wall biosynthesis
MSRHPIPVLHFTRTVARYGAEEHILTLLRHFGRDRFRLHLVCMPELAEQIRKDLPDDVVLFPMDLTRLGRLEAAREFARILRERRIEILHSHMSFSSRFASPVGAACGVPVILETPHVAENWRRGWWKSLFVVDRCFGRFVDYFIAVSQANARYLADQKGLPSARVAVIHNGCDLNRFVPRRGIVYFSNRLPKYAAHFQTFA